jgi:hypothetical protein
VSNSARIFVNYRREDSAGFARQLHKDLAARFGEERVFRDVGIEPGADYIEDIEQVMNDVEVCLVLIGRNWINAADASGRRRLDDPRDLLRLEIESALIRDDVRVIPVLLDGAPMPGEHELPEGLRRLARRNASLLTDRGWEDDVRRLSNSLRSALGESTLRHERVVKSPESHASPPRAGSDPLVSRAVLATLGAAVGSAIAAAIVSRPLVGLGAGEWGRLLGYSVERGVIWALIGAVVVAAVSVTFSAVRAPLESALAGAAAGALGGAAGGAGYMILKHFAEVTEQDSLWLLTFVATVLPALAIVAAIAGAADAPERMAACVLAAIAGAAAAALLNGSDRIVLLAVHALLVIGPSVAVLAAFPVAEPDPTPAVPPERTATT